MTIIVTAAMLSAPGAAPMTPFAALSSKLLELALALKLLFVSSSGVTDWISALSGSVAAAAAIYSAWQLDLKKT